MQCRVQTIIIAILSVLVITLASLLIISTQANPDNHTVAETSADIGVSAEITRDLAPFVRDKKGYVDFLQNNWPSQTVEYSAGERILFSLQIYNSPHTYADDFQTICQLEPGTPIRIIQKGPLFTDVEPMSSRDFSIVETVEGEQCRGYIRTYDIGMDEAYNKYPDSDFWDKWAEWEE